MKILYVSGNAIPWPATSGGRIRNAKIIEGLARRHDLTIALANDPEMNREALNSGAEAASRCRTLEGEFPWLPRRLMRRTWAKYRPVYPPTSYNRYRKSFLKLVEELQPDLVWYFQAESLWGTGLAPGIPSVYDLCDIESTKYARTADRLPTLSRLMAKLDCIWFKHIERHVADMADVVLVANPDDTRRLRIRSSLRVMPNGCDFPARLEVLPRPGKRLLFVGWLEYPPNLDGAMWFCDKVWPLIAREEPDAVLDIVGRYSDSAQRLRSIPGVTLHGFADRLEPFYDQAAFTIVPLRVGSGTRLKIVESWAKGISVVSTQVGCEGLGAVDGETILIGDTPEELARKCVMLLRSPELGADIADRAFHYGKENFEWTNLYGILEAAAAEALARHR